MGRRVYGGGGLGMVRWRDRDVKEVIISLKYSSKQKGGERRRQRKEKVYTLRESGRRQKGDQHGRGDLKNGEDDIGLKPRGRRKERDRRLR